MIKSIPTLTAEEAAALINDKDTIGFGGFTAAGACKVIPSPSRPGPKPSMRPGAHSNWE